MRARDRAPWSTRPAQLVSFVGSLRRLPRVARAVERLQGDQRGLVRTASEHGRRLTHHASRLDRQRSRIAALEASAAAAAGELASLRGQVAELQGDLAQERGLALRTAELADVVTHLLAAAGGDPEVFRAAARAYADEL